MIDGSQPPPDPFVERAVARLDGGDPAGALDALLTSWRACPRVAIADRIDALSAWLAPAVKPLDGESAKAKHDAWLIRAGEGRAVDQPVLAAYVAVPPHVRVHDRLTWLVAQPPDPRWTAAMVATVGANLSSAREWGPSRTQRRSARLAVEVLKRSGDQRALAALSALSGRVEVANWVRRLENVTQPDGPALPATQLATLDTALEQATAAPPATTALGRAAGESEAQLLAMIHAAPADIDARRIYADWLESVGSPRAEFVRLQLKRVDGRFLKKDARREADLLRRHGLSWLGRLAPFVREVDWHLGLPAAGNIKFRSRGERGRALESAAWRTFTEVHVKDPAVLEHPHLAQVEQLGRIGSIFDRQSKAQPIDHLVVNGVGTPLAATRLVLHADELGTLDWSRLPALDSIDLVHRHYAFADDLNRYERLLANRSWDRVAFWKLPPYFAVRLAESLPAVRRLELAYWEFSLGLTRSSAGDHLDLIANAYTIDFSVALELANRLAPARVRIHTVAGRQPAAVLARWRSMLKAPIVDLPRARRTIARS